MKSTYNDELVCITNENITFFNYYFPTCKKKVVKIADIESVVVLKPTLKSGKWRIHGTGSFKVWFPNDNDRPSRDRIFKMVLKNQWVDIGFTVKNGDLVEELLTSRGLIKQN
ncbi:hypothetical protein [Desulfotignum balticum]|jgi:hypothetical protein|uniref:hypothetical protein n=1 Tax=Desulfotignum balticum TaxID=115781 RepID=UPI00046250BA|nr:hypothetical protein [Desulfotignum balticum]